MIATCLQRDDISPRQAAKRAIAYAKATPLKIAITEYRGLKILAHADDDEIGFLVRKIKNALEPHNATRKGRIICTHSWGGSPWPVTDADYAWLNDDF